jgi:transcriptional adapter 2-alpha
MELELCSTLRLLPTHYLVIRDTIVRESIRLGYLSAVDANALLNIDIRKTGRVYYFLVSAGLVTNTTTNKGVYSPKEKK